MAQTYAGRHRDALGTCAEALALSSGHGERWAQAYSFWIRGVTRWHLDDGAGATSDAREALILQRDFKDSICTALTIELLAWVEAGAKNFERAAQLAAAAAAVWIGLGTSVDAFGPDTTQDSLHAQAAVERALGRKRVDEVRARYVGIDKDAAIDLALETSPRPSTVGAGAQKSPLTKARRRDRPFDRTGDEQPGDRGSPVHLTAHRRRTRRTDPREAGLHLPHAGGHLGGRQRRHRDRAGNRSAPPAPRVRRATQVPDGVICPMFARPAQARLDVVQRWLHHPEGPP